MRSSNEPPDDELMTDDADEFDEGGREGGASLPYTERTILLPCGMRGTGGGDDGSRWLRKVEGARIELIERCVRSVPPCED
jgi:hypothetical protein